MSNNDLDRNALLLLVDVQDGFRDPEWGERNNPHAEANMARLLDAWRRTDRPVLHFQHSSRRLTSPLHPSSPGHRIQEIVGPLEHEPVMQKQVNSCFVGTGLETWLRERQIQTLVIAGLTTPHCVSTTARMAANLGFDPMVVHDATAAFEVIGHDGRRYDPETVHQLSLATLHGEFAAVVATGELLAAIRD